MSRLSRARGVLACALLLGTGTAADLLAQSPAVPPDGIVFRNPFVDINGNVLIQNVTRPDSLELRSPFVDVGGSVLDQFVPAPRHLEFRDPFVDADGHLTMTSVAAPTGLEFREAFVDILGNVLIQDLEPPRGIVFRDPFVDSDGRTRPTAAPDAPPGARLLSLGGVVPNPFNPGTQISFRLREAAEVTVSVLDLQGRLVRTLQQGRLPAELHVLRWDGRDAAGGQAASGVYVFRIQAGSETLQAKGVLLK